MSHWGNQISSLPLKRQDGFAAPQELWELTLLICFIPGQRLFATTLVGLGETQPCCLNSTMPRLCVIIHSNHIRGMLWPIVLTAQQFLKTSGLHTAYQPSASLSLKEVESNRPPSLSLAFSLISGICFPVIASDGCITFVQTGGALFLGTSFRESPVAAGSWPSSPERHLGRARDLATLVLGNSRGTKDQPKGPLS